jgi:hypothetical protein
MNLCSSENLVAGIEEKCTVSFGLCVVVFKVLDDDELSYRTPYGAQEQAARFLPISTPNP